MAGWLLGLGIGLFTRNPLPVRVVVGAAGLIVFVGAIVGGAMAGGDEPIAGFPWALGAAAAWVVGNAAAASIRFAHRHFIVRASREPQKERGTHDDIPRGTG